MATEKYFCFDEQGELKRIKGRLVRFLDNEAPTGSDKSAIRTSLEVSPDAEGLVQADVGTAPNEIPVNGMLGDMAYQSSDSVSVAELQVESTTGTGTTEALTVTDGTDTKFLVREDGRLGVNTASPAQDIHVTGADPSIRLQDTSAGGSSELEALNGSLVIGSDIGNTVAGSYIMFKVDGSEAARIDSDGRLGVNQTSPGSYSGAANNLVVGSGSGAEGITIATGAASQGGIYFADGTSGGDMYRGSIIYQHSDDSLRFSSNATTRWQISSAGHLISNNGLYGIDFGSTTSGTGNTVTSGLLDDYEEGDWTPSVSVGSITGTGLTYVGKYTKIGRLVHIYIRVNATAHDINVSSYVGFTGVPFSISTKASGTVIGEDIDVTAQQGFASISGGTLFFGACGNSSAVGLTATLTGYI